MNRLMEILIFLLLGVILVSALLGIKEAKIWGDGDLWDGLRELP